MAYKGLQVQIPLGQLGLVTDDPMTSLPPNSAILANNITMKNSRLEKSLGSARYSPLQALDAPIVGVFDWHPAPGNQRLVALTSNGKCWQDLGTLTWSSNTPIATGLGSLSSDVCFLSAGNEDASQNKKLFIFTGTSQLRFIDGAGASLTTVAHPAADWATSFPKFGVLYQNRVVAFGNANSPHTLYFSKTDDHQKFNGTASESPQFPVFPGEGEGLVSAVVYKGRLFLFKRPYGVYYLEDNQSVDPTHWSIKKLSDAFGVAAPNAVTQVLDDLVAANSTGSLTSMMATQDLGDIKAGDILANAQVEEYIKQIFDSAGISATHAIYYNEKKRALFSAREEGATTQNRLLILDVARQNVRITIETKDQPNCLSLRKDSDGILRPIYGANDGHVYLMEKGTYNINGLPYNAEFQTPFMDFSFADPNLASKNKIFDFLELQYVPVGNYPILVDVFIDGKFSQTLTFTQQQGGVLDSFVLDTDIFGTEQTQDKRLPLKGVGKRISFKFYNGNLDEYFKLEKFIVSFRVSGEQQNKFTGKIEV